MTNGNLEVEARYFHRAIFRSDPTEEFVRRYQAASRQLFRDADIAELANIQRIVLRRLDCVAIEYAARRIRPTGLLTAKLRMACYLAEATAGHFDDFVNSRQHRLGAWFALAIAGAWMIFLRIKGFYLVKRHRLA